MQTWERLVLLSRSQGPSALILCDGLTAWELGVVQLLKPLGRLPRTRLLKPSLPVTSSFSFYLFYKMCKSSFIGNIF
jgi:hypothetical protein